jgi:hypothetical protein
MGQHLGEEHDWELHGVEFDMQVGAVEVHECTGCPAVTVRQSAPDLLPPS